MRRFVSWLLIAVVLALVVCISQTVEPLLNLRNRAGDIIWESLLNLAPIAPLGVFGTAMVAFFAYRGTLRQKTEADNRNAWWNRVQWAIDATFSGELQKQGVGMKALTHMQSTDKGTVEEDQKFLRALGIDVTNVIRVSAGEEPMNVDNLPVAVNESVEDNGEQEVVDEPATSTK